MSLITLERDAVTYSVNSAHAKINKFTDKAGNEAYVADIEGLGNIALTAEEYSQFKDNNEENTIK